jgi:hypothetical protein
MTDQLYVCPNGDGTGKCKDGLDCLEATPHEHHLECDLTCKDAKCIPYVPPVTPEPGFEIAPVGYVAKEKVDRCMLHGSHGWEPVTIFAGQVVDSDGGFKDFRGRKWSIARPIAPALTPLQVLDQAVREASATYEGELKHAAKRRDETIDAAVEKYREAVK